MNGAMFIAACLQQEGVTKVFGQCGHTNYALIDACHKIGIEYISFRHEQQAVHAADAYFRVSHKLAVVNVHLSPGLTNALTGVATAAADGTHEEDNFQWADIGTGSNHVHGDGDAGIVAVAERRKQVFRLDA